MECLCDSASRSQYLLLTMMVISVCVTIDVIAVVEVFVVERGTHRHQLMQSHFSDEQTAREVQMLQQRKPSSLRETPTTHTVCFTFNQGKNRQGVLPHASVLCHSLALQCIQRTR